MAQRPANSFTTLGGGVKVHYDRPPIAPYGSQGKPLTFHATEETEATLDRAFEEIWKTCPLGKADVITTAGAFVDKPNSFHNTGKAFDLDGIHWKEKAFVTLNYPSDKRFYLGIEAILRKHFATVLNFHFNAAHRDHLHVDLGGEVGFTKVKSKIFFLQAAISHVVEIPIDIDGEWGDETAGGAKKALEKLGIEGSLEDKAVWLKFLTKVAASAFGTTVQPKEKTAHDLLQDVYSVIAHELAEQPARKRIETALTAFVNHPDIQEAIGVEEQPPIILTGKKFKLRRDAAKKKWFASVNGGDEFFVGQETSFTNKKTGKVTKGLMNLDKKGIKYKPDDYRAEYGFWADFIFPTACSESLGGLFHCLNTYDRAFFTVGFMQYAAHTFEGDFVKYLRALLALPEAADYFPDLSLKDGKVCRKNGTEAVLLEAKTKDDPLPTAFMKYFNPTSDEVEEEEVEKAARFIHWMQNSAENRKLQVKMAVEHFRENMKKYAEKYKLDGMTDKVCLVITDIHHQGRGKATQVKAALDTNGNAEKAFENLLKIGADNFEQRIKTLRETIAESVAAGKLGKMKYSRTKSDFVPI